MTATPEALRDWQSAIGRTVTRTQWLEAESLRRFAVAIGADPDVERILPPLAHWAWFLDTPQDDGIGADGHPKRGGFLPAITLPRRMFAASAIRFEAPLQPGAEAELESRIEDVRHRPGAGGDLVFVDIARRISQDGVDRVTERQTLVYRGAADAGGLPVPAGDAEAVPAKGELWRPEEVNLFRFSAATFNGHRIHYDRPYATRVEGYPSLVVQGPFTAARLAGLAARDGALAALEFRLLAPLYAAQPVRLIRGEADEYRAVRCDGVTATSLKVTRR
jgi:3-methylfumaryl-CoA hydratase